MSCEHAQDRRELAQKILLYSRRYITRKCPIMLAPIYALREEVSPIPGPLATDGVRLWYDPERVIRDFQADRNSPARQLLHVTLHCLMGHLPARRLQSDTGLFDTAADWKIDELIGALNHRQTVSGWFWHTDLPLARLVQRCGEDEELRENLYREAQEQEVAQDDHGRWSPPVVERTVQACAASWRSASRTGLWMSRWCSAAMAAAAVPSPRATSISMWLSWAHLRPTPWATPADIRARPTPGPSAVHWAMRCPTPAMPTRWW